MEPSDLSQFAQTAEALGMTADQLRSALFGPVLLAVLYGFMRASKFAYKKATHLYWWATAPAPVLPPTYTEQGRIIAAVLDDRSETALAAWEFSDAESTIRRDVNGVQFTVWSSGETNVSGVSPRLITADDTVKILKSGYDLYQCAIERRAMRAMAALRGAAASITPASTACSPSNDPPLAGRLPVPTGNLCEWFIKAYSTDAWLRFYGILTNGSSGEAERVLHGLGWRTKEDAPDLTVLKKLASDCPCPTCMKLRENYRAAADRLSLPVGKRVVA